MNRRIFFVVLFLPFLFSCRNSLMDLSSEKASLSVGISIDRSLYSGNFGQEPGRFIDLSSDSLSVTYTVGDRDFTTTAVLEVSSEDPGKLTATATLQNLPASVPGTVRVETFNKNGILVCDRYQEMELSGGDNKVTLTLRISPDSPLLDLVSAGEYIYKLISPGESIFLGLGPLTAGKEYYLIGDTINDIVSEEILTLVTDTGSLLPVTTIPDKDELFFTAGENGSYVYFSVYNGAPAQMEAMAWWGEASGHTGLVNTDRIDASDSNSDLLTSMIYTTTAPSYRPISAGSGVFHMTIQYDAAYGGYYLNTSDGSNWNISSPSSLLGSTITSLFPTYQGIPDIYIQDNFAIMSLFYLIDNSTTFDYVLAIKDMNNIYNHLPDHTQEMEYTISNYYPPYINNRVSYSGTHAVLATVDQSGNLHIGMSETYPGYVGPFNPATIAFSNEIGTADNLQIASIDRTCYVIADSGSVYTYSPGASGLSGPVFSIAADTDTYRTLGILKNKYIIASSPREASVYFPGLNKTLDVYDETDPPDEIQSLIDQGYSFEFHFFSSENYLVLVQVMDIPQVGAAYLINVSENGGFSWLQSEVLNPSLGNIFKVDAAIDESLGEIYIGLTIGLAGPTNYELKTFKLQ